MWRVQGAIGALTATSTSQPLAVLPVTALISRPLLSVLTSVSVPVFKVLEAVHATGVCRNTTIYPQLAALHVTAPPSEFVAAPILVTLSLVSVPALVMLPAETAHNAPRAFSRATI